ncbi:MAG: hypothetical protein QG599_1871 [Pseudomonadota bacterium]|nr:hypothetical protein [Pseudomonadota bacterium]
MKPVFLDTAYAKALKSEKDDFHDRALALADYLEENQVPLVTTRNGQFLFQSDQEKSHANRC